MRGWGGWEGTKINKVVRVIAMVRPFLDVASNEADNRLWGRIEAASRAMALISFCDAHWQRGPATAGGIQGRGFKKSKPRGMEEKRGMRPQASGPSGKMKRPLSELHHLELSAGSALGIQTAA